MQAKHFFLDITVDTVSPTNERLPDDRNGNTPTTSADQRSSSDLGQGYEKSDQGGEIYAAMMTPAPTRTPHPDMELHTDPSACGSGGRWR